MALQLREMGHPKAYALVGGFDAWKVAGGEVEPLARGDASANAGAHQPM